MKYFYFLVLINGLFATIANAVPCQNLPLWNANTIYYDGDRVKHEGSAYRANWWSRYQNPAQNSGQWRVWTLLGNCNGAAVNQPPTANVNGPYSGTIDTAIAFTSNGSSDSDGTINNYFWEFGNGQQSFLANPSYSYDDTGVFNVTLTVTDNDGATDSATTTVTVRSIDIPTGSTPVEQNGQLTVCGTKLCNKNNRPIQLRGMSTHGLQWYGWGDCVTERSLDALAEEWQADILRISLYVQEGGYETDPEGFTRQVHRIIEEATERGLYALVDWHQLTPGNPNANTQMAIRFFTDIAQRHQGKNNILYDIANEPNNTPWSEVKRYAERMIPVIRQYDDDAVILVGTHGWSSLGISDGGSPDEIIGNPIQASNFMYTFHFYAASHRDYYLNQLDRASEVLPIFVTEFGTQTYTGDGGNDFAMAQRYIDLMARKKISWTNWNFSDDFRSGAVFKTGTCASNGPFTGSNLKPAGRWIQQRIQSPADDF